MEFGPGKRTFLLGDFRLTMIDMRRVIPSQQSILVFPHYYFMLPTPLKFHLLTVINIRVIPSQQSILVFPHYYFMVPTPLKFHFTHCNQHAPCNSQPAVHSCIPSLLFHAPHSP
uniref:Uncharacterized protein n=1 Tax=Cacopsylla melanoneura TaxID=428564 RepID=A0A8D9E8Y6_9HEMI